MKSSPPYFRVLMTFARNSLVRDMTYRTDFLIESISSISWAFMNVGFYLIVFQHTPLIGENTGWGKYEFFTFLATTWLINSLIQAFFMPNAEEFSELIRTGNLDFALLKPIDTQFLISFQKVDWSALSNLAMGAILLVASLWQLTHREVHTNSDLAIRHFSVPLLHFLRGADHVQLDDLVGGHEHLAGTQSIALRFLVLYHQLRSLSDGDLSARLGQATMGRLHIYCAGARRRECACANTRSTAAAARVVGMAVGRFHHLCRDRKSCRVAVGVSASPE